jgi:hypothetical protein
LSKDVGTCDFERKHVVTYVGRAFETLIDQFLGNLNRINWNIAFLGCKGSQASLADKAVLEVLEDV